MSRTFVLHQLNAVELAPADFVRLAAQNDVDRVTLFAFDGGSVLPRSNSGLTYPTAITPQTRQDVLDTLADTGVGVDGVEFFPMTESVDLELYRPALELGAELGARRAVSHVFIGDDALLVDKLGALCDMAAAVGLGLSVEFCPLTPGCPSLARGAWLVEQLDRPGFGLGFDALHVVRSGCSPEQIAQLGERYFGIAQICDALGTQVSSDYIADVHNREVPGSGDLPLREILNAVPASVPIEAEVPAAHRRLAGVSAAQHVAEVVAGSRAIIDSLRPAR